jgi:hypothetical protein
VVRRWCAAGAPVVRRRLSALCSKCAFRAIGVAKMKSKLFQMLLANASLENVPFASAGAPFCFKTFNFLLVFQHFAPGQKRRFQVGGVHILKFQQNVYDQFYLSSNCNSST